jgi:protein gp37
VGNDAHTALLNWIITGGESGRNARTMEVGWVNDIHRQAKAAGVAVHHKQMGAAWAEANGAAHKKGGDPTEWPEAFRRREFPDV